MAAAAAAAGGGATEESSMQPPAVDGDADSPPTSPPPALAAEAGKDAAEDREQDIVLEGSLLKQGSRSRHFWHERYVTFSSNHTLRYYKQRGDEEPKGCYHLPELPELSVSDVYIEKHHTTAEMIYCVKITWAPDRQHPGAPTNDETSHGDDSWAIPAGSGGGGSDEFDVVVEGREAGATPNSWKRRGRRSNVNSPDIGNGYNGPLSPCSSFGSSVYQQQSGLRQHRGRIGTGGKRNGAFARFRKRTGGNGGDNRRNRSNGSMRLTPTEEEELLQGVRSVDRESLTVGSNKQEQARPRARTMSTFKKSNLRSDININPDGDAHDAEGVPDMVEVNQTMAAARQQQAAGGASVPTTPSAMPQTPTDRELLDSSEGNGNNTMATPPTSNSSFLKRQRSANASVASTKPLTEYERQRLEDLQYLRAQFLSAQLESKKRTNKKLVNGTKIALAAGAAIGLTVVTAGIGLVAGLVVLGVGAAAGGGGAAVQATWKKKTDGELVLASSDYELIRMWKACLDASKDSDSIRRSKWGQLFVSDGRKTNSALLPRMLVFQDIRHQDNNVSLSTMPTDNLGQHSLPGADSERTSSSLNLEPDAKWEPLDGGWASYLCSGTQGLRIFREVPEKTTQQLKTSKVSVDGPACAPMKAHVVLNTTPLDAFLCVMSYGRMAQDLQHHSSHGSVEEVDLSPNSEQRASFRVVESIDDQTDIIHLVFRPLYLFPSWTTPRDYCLFRYWRLEQDGSYMVCYESMEHPSCPQEEGFVRGEMHQVITIAPQKRSYRRRNKAGYGEKPRPDCLMTAVTQVDPKGWVPTSVIPFLTNQRYADAFGVATLSLLLEIRDAIDHDRFIPVSVERNGVSEGGGSYESAAQLYPNNPPQCLTRQRSMDSVDEEVIADDSRNYDFAYANRESLRMVSGLDIVDLSTNPPPLQKDKWAEPDSNSFRVRGPDYKVDRHKINAGLSLGRLVAADVIWSDEPIYSGFSLHPTERIQLALKKEEALRRKGLKSDMPPFIFVVTIVLPGPPYYYGVYYFAVDDMSTIDGSDGAPSSKLCKQFFFGDSDEFRDRTFKLIPQIVQGNFIVKKAVGSTPAILGTKLRQLYVKRDRFCEVICDCGSSSVATGVIKLSLGYAKTLVIDMGFLLEGDDESTLPERMFGSVRMKQIDFGPNLRKVAVPPPNSFF